MQFKGTNHIGYVGARGKLTITINGKKETRDLAGLVPVTMEHKILSDYLADVKRRQGGRPTVEIELELEERPAARPPEKPAEPLLLLQLQVPCRLCGAVAGSPCVGRGYDQAHHVRVLSAQEGVAMGVWS